MSSRKKKRESPMPASSAGLLRFFEDETSGVKVRPEIVVLLSIAIVVASLVLRVVLPV
ncbi:MAG: preprotein translocase subunit Sec61beta [Thaumarchaeota archaeon]|nr:preprotein translocase subunit Sec61beta [Nitrososphaerota archaeon]